MKYMSMVLAAGAGAAFATQAMAADPVVEKTEVRAILNTITFEVSPEFNIRATSSQERNSLNDATFKIGYSRSLGNGWSVGISDQQTVRAVGTGLYANQLEGTVGYNVKLNDVFSVPLSAGVGYVWDTRNASSLLTEQDWAYYVFTAGVNVKLTKQFTWNAISGRYRDAFDGDWKTPKISTGVTYAINPNNAVYANVGYAWKTGAGGEVAPDIGPDKWSVAVGYKISF